jgi:hypothetical protein
MFRPFKWSPSGPSQSHKLEKAAHTYAFCNFMALCDGPDDDHLNGRNMLSVWYFYGNKRILLCWRIIFYTYCSTPWCILVNPTKEANGIWRIQTNKELDELIKHRNIINYVKAQRLSWYGHINRIPETSIVKRIHKWKPFTGRPAGRPKSRWEDDVRNNLKKMKLTEWAEQVQDRLKWKDIVEKAKTLSCSAIGGGGRRRWRWQWRWRWR